ncbi:hypothetical protein D9M69_510950 [compost metagenome]
MQAGACNIVANLVTLEVNDARTDWSFGGVVRVWNRHNRITIVRNRHAMMWSNHIRCLHIWFLIKNGFFCEEPRRIFTIKPLRNIALTFDKMCGLCAGPLNIEKFGVIDINVGMIPMIMK